MGKDKTYRTASIQKVLRAFPNAALSLSPSPIHKLSRLSAHLGHHTYIMREDLTGFAIGGNKVRKLDYLIGDAVAAGADTLVTLKASSFSRNAAAAELFKQGANLRRLIRHSVK